MAAAIAAATRGVQRRRVRTDGGHAHVHSCHAHRQGGCHDGRHGPLGRAIIIAIVHLHEGWRVLHRGGQRHTRRQLHVVVAVRCHRD